MSYFDPNWMKWMDQYMDECKTPLKFTLDELRAAWQSGKTPTQVAQENDAPLNCTK